MGLLIEKNGGAVRRVHSINRDLFFMIAHSGVGDPCITSELII